MAQMAESKTLQVVKGGNCTATLVPDFLLKQALGLTALNAYRIGP